MPEKIGSLSFNGLSLLKPATWIPIFGNFCGPGWTAGTREKITDVSDIKNTPPIRIKWPDGSFKPSLLDEICQDHDQSYFFAEGKPNEYILKAKADSYFVDRIEKNFELFSELEKPYASLAGPLFSAKYSVVDKPTVDLLNFIDKINHSIENLIKKSGTPKEVSLTDQDGNTISRTIDDDGKITLSYNTADESQSLTLDEMMRLTGASQQFMDESGEVYEETQISVNNASGISEITHITDGKIDAEGVIVGKLSQEKLDQFAELANSATPQTSDGSDSDLGALLPDTQVSAASFNASGLLDSMNVHIDDLAAQEVNDWFADADPIRLQAYQWDHIDKNLQNLWAYGNEDTLAAFDLQSVMDANDIEWDADLGGWDYPDSLSSLDGSGLDFGDFNSFEYSLSDIDLGLGNDAQYNVDYSYNAWANDSSFGGDWSGSYLDPLVVKIGKGSVHTTNLEGSTVMFDMQANGKKVRTGWITPDHAFLVRDRNRNGQIDDSSEMFSERTSPKAATGFAALAQLDSNRDGWVSYKDKAFKELRLWTDINADGLTQKGELHTLDEFGIRFFVVAKPVAKNVYDNGNLILNTNTYHSETRRGIYVGEIAEVLFNFGDAKPVTSVYISDQATAVRTAEGKTVQVLSDTKAQTINASMSGINLLVGGKGDVLNAGNAQQSLLIGNGGATLNGNGGSTHFVVNNSGNTVNTGTGDSFIEVNGDANIINATKGDVHMDVDGNRNKITIGSNDFVDLGGTGNTLAAAGNTKGNEVVISGQKLTVSLSNADIALNENSSLTLNGKNNDITMEGHSTLSGNVSGGTLLAWGEDNVATISNAFVGMAEGTELLLGGKNNQIVMAGDDELVLKDSGAGTTVNVFGEDNKLTMAGGAIKMASGSELDLAGRSNTVTMLGDADLLARDKGQRLEVYGDDNHATVSGSTIIEHGLAEIDIDGLANTLRYTPTRADLLQKELDNYLGSTQLVQTVWTKYEQLADSSVAQPWRGLQPEVFGNELQPAMFDDGAGSGAPSGNLGSTLFGSAAGGLQARPLIPSAASAQPVSVFS